jgi:uncharacterized protein (TIGR03067 family)
MKIPFNKWWPCIGLLLLALTGCLDSHSTGASLEGNWELFHLEINGFVYPDEKVKGVMAGMNESDFQVTQAGGVTLYLGKYRMEEQFYPKHLDVWVAGSDDAGNKRNGIFRIKSDTLEACFAAPGAYRPASFETRNGDKQVLTVWVKRQMP